MKLIYPLLLAPSSQRQRRTQKQLATPTARAATQSAGFKPSGQRGGAFFAKHFAVSERMPACTSCHTEQAAQPGACGHRKEIKPMAVRRQQANALPIWRRSRNGSAATARKSSVANAPRAKRPTSSSSPWKAADMKMLKSALLLAIVCASTAAFADRMPIPANAPPAFKAECGSSTWRSAAAVDPDDWHRVMATLDHITRQRLARRKDAQTMRNFSSHSAPDIGANSPSPRQPARLPAQRVSAQAHECRIRLARHARQRARNCAACIRCRAGQLHDMK